MAAFESQRNTVEDIDAQLDERETETAHLAQAETVGDLLNTRRWLEGQQFNHAVSLAAEKLSFAETDDIEELQERISTLQAELYTLSATKSVKELVVKRMLYSYVLLEKMFEIPLPATSCETTVDSTKFGGDRREFEVYLRRHCKLSKEILHIQESIDALREELDTVRKRNFELKKENRGLMNTIAQHQKRLESLAADVRNDSSCKELTEELESAIARVEIAKCTLQALILGSGVDWAQDPELQETLFLCGDTLKL